MFFALWLSSSVALLRSRVEHCEEGACPVAVKRRRRRRPARGSSPHRVHRQGRRSGLVAAAHGRHGTPRAQAHQVRAMQTILGVKSGFWAKRRSFFKSFVWSKSLQQPHRVEQSLLLTNVRPLRLPLVPPLDPCCIFHPAVKQTMFFA